MEIHVFQSCGFGERSKYQNEVIMSKQEPIWSDYLSGWAIGFITGTGLGLLLAYEVIRDRNILTRRSAKRDEK